MQAIYPLVDTLLECTVHASDVHSNFGDLVGCVDCIVFPESNMIQVVTQPNQILASIKFCMGLHTAHQGFFFQNYLESFVESVDSTYGCVLSENGMVTATKNWYSLHPDEIVLLTLYLQSDIRSTLRDTPIFLPVKSPTVSSYHCIQFYC